MEYSCGMTRHHVTPNLELGDVVSHVLAHRLDMLPFQPRQNVNLFSRLLNIEDM
jgi:hypothetical protein